MSAAIQERMARAHLGIEMEVFRESTAYKHLVACAEQRYQGAVAELIDADPTDVGIIARAQADARVFLEMRQWIETAIQGGQLAAVELRAQDYAE